MADTPKEDHEIIDEWIGDVSCFTPEGYHSTACMWPDIDGEWVRYDDVKTAILAKLKRDSEVTK